MFSEMGKVLFLHGWSSDGGRKSSFMRSLGCDVWTPRLSNWSFRRAVRTAQAAHDDFRPDVIVGSSRGGAAAMCVENRGTPLVLLAPAWRTWGVEPVLQTTKTVLIHSPNDRLVPLVDSIEVSLRNPGVRLLVAGDDHRLNDHEAQRALQSALASFVRHCPTDQARTNSF